MAPTKSTTRAVSNQAVTMNAVLPPARKGVARRTNALNQQVNDAENMQTRGKRKADNSPIKNEKIKRSALGNLTNNVKILSLHGDEDAKVSLNNVTNVKKQTAQQLQALMDAKNLMCAVAADTAQTQPTTKAVAAPSTTTAAPAPLAAAAIAAGGGYRAPADIQKVVTRAASKLSDDVIDEGYKLDVFGEKVVTRARRKPAQKKPAPPPAAPLVVPAPVLTKVNTTKPMRRISNEFNKTDESLYMSALEDVSSCESMRLSSNFEAARRRSAQLQQSKQQPEKTDSKECAAETDAPLNTSVETLCVAQTMPEDVEDFDKLNWNDPFQVSHFAMDIFNYMKSREKDFIIEDYIQMQPHLSKWMRTLLVDWMVEVQETFELNHETLYLAVKIVDRYLCRKVVHKEKLQLLGAAALFIACKFDERQPPLIEDFLYICDGAYKHDELVRMEMDTLRAIDYDLGIPLSYRFLRRYARCAKVKMPTLTLARYILELALMDYATISLSDSKMASAALFIALRMHSTEAGGDPSAAVWTSTLVYYTGYNLSDFADIVPILNTCLHRKPKGTIKTIRSKYSHRIFHEVAKVNLLSSGELFKNDLNLNANSVADS